MKKLLKQRGKKIGKGEYLVDLDDTPATLRIVEDGLYIGGERTVPAELADWYLTYLLAREPVYGWDKNTMKIATRVLAVMYGDRVINHAGKQIAIDQPEDPSIIHLGKMGEVQIVWSGPAKNVNVYDYADCLRHLTAWSQSPVANIEYTGFATMQDIEANPVLMSRLLEPSNPQPPQISIEAIRANALELVSTMDQYWHDAVNNQVFKTKAGDNVTQANKQCLEITEARYKELHKRGGAQKVRTWPKKTTATGSGTTRSKSKEKLLDWGAPPKKRKHYKKARAAISAITSKPKQIRLLIERFDFDNGTIIDLAECDDSQLQRVRRKIKKELDQ